MHKLALRGIDTISSFWEHWPAPCSAASARCSASVLGTSTFPHAAIAQLNRRSVPTTVRAHPFNTRRCKVSITLQRFRWFSAKKRKCRLEIIDLSRSTALINPAPESCTPEVHEQTRKHDAGQMLSRPSQTLFTAPLSCANCFLAALTTPPQASTPRCVPALCDDPLPTSRQHGCRRQRILSFELPVLFPRRQSDADSTDRVAPIAPSVFKKPTPTSRQNGQELPRPL